MAVVISSKTHEDVREESTEFMKGVDVSELEGLVGLCIFLFYSIILEDF